MNQLLIFATAGVAFADYEIDESYAGVSPTMIDETLNGWTAGGGADYAFTDRVFGRFEYRYSDFSSASSIQYSNWFPFDAELKTHDIRLGVAYKF